MAFPAAFGAAGLTAGTAAVGTVGANLLTNKIVSENVALGLAQLEANHQVDIFQAALTFAATVSGKLAQAMQAAARGS